MLFDPTAKILSDFLKSSNSYLQDLMIRIDSMLIQRSKFNLAISLGSKCHIFYLIVDFEYVF